VQVVGVGRRLRYRRRRAPGLPLDVVLRVHHWTAIHSVRRPRGATADPQLRGGRCAAAEWTVDGDGSGVRLMGRA